MKFYYTKSFHGMELKSCLEMLSYSTYSHFIGLSTCNFKFFYPETEEKVPEKLFQSISCITAEVSNNS